MSRAQMESEYQYRFWSRVAREYADMVLHGLKRHYYHNVALHAEAAIAAQANAIGWASR